MFLIDPKNVFASIQGEGSYAGTPAIFVRFQRCPHRCTFCDTKETWEVSELQLPLDFLLAKIEFLYSKWPGITRIIFTGGEPLYGQNGEDLPDLINLCFIRYGLLPHIETSGTEYPSDFLKRLILNPFITISPKVKNRAEAEFIPVRSELLSLPKPDGREFKFLVDDTAASVVRIENFIAMLRKRFSIYLKAWPLVKKIYIQPVDFGREDPRTRLAVERAVNLCKTQNWHLSCQMHKFLGIE